MSNDFDLPDVLMMAVLSVLAPIIVGAGELLYAVFDATVHVFQSTSPLLVEPLFAMVTVLESLGMFAIPVIVIAALVVIGQWHCLKPGVGPTVTTESPGDKWQSETEQTVENAAEKVRNRYVVGEIDEIEMEQQLARALDPEFHELRDRVEEIGGIGDDLSKAIAIRFDSVEDLRMADDEDLRRVNGVGEQRAEAIRERV